MSTPVLGVQGGAYPAKGSWQASFGWRYQKSDQHFIGSELQVNRTNEGSQVINRVHLADLNVTYQASKRTSLSVGIPYFMGTRSQALRNSSAVIIGRQQTQARDIGDMMVTARHWMLDPAKHSGGNLMLGFGVKLPTGPNNITDTFNVLTPGTTATFTQVVRTVDQSIQPGDGGFGLLLDVNGFKQLGGGNIGVYMGGSYLANPSGTSGVRTYRTAVGEEIMSIADQFLLRAGASVAVPGVQGKKLSLTVGGRMEGVPVRDIIGPDNGFRRPGVAVSIEPSLSYVAGKQVVTLGVPIAVYRNRFTSVPDEARGAHGDAAFAKYLVMFGVSRRF